MPDIQSQLARFQGKTPATPQEVRQMAAAAWHEHHILLVPLNDKEMVMPQMDRFYIETIGNKLFGERVKK